MNAAAALALAVFGGVKAPARTDSAASTRPFVTVVCASDSHAIGGGAAAFPVFIVPSVTAPSRAIPAAVFMRGSLNQHAARVGSPVGVACHARGDHESVCSPRRETCQGKNQATARAMISSLTSQPIAYDATKARCSFRNAALVRMRGKGPSTQTAAASLSSVGVE